MGNKEKCFIGVENIFKVLFKCYSLKVYTHKKYY